MKKVWLILLASSLLTACVSVFGGVETIGIWLVGFGLSTFVTVNEHNKLSVTTMAERRMLRSIVIAVTDHHRNIVGLHSASDKSQWRSSAETQQKMFRLARDIRVELGLESKAPEVEPKPVTESKPVAESLH